MQDLSTGRKYKTWAVDSSLIINGFQVFLSHVACTIMGMFFPSFLLPLFSKFASELLDFISTRKINVKSLNFSNENVRDFAFENLGNIVDDVDEFGLTMFGENIMPITGEFYDSKKGHVVMEIFDDDGNLGVKGVMRMIVLFLCSPKEQEELLILYSLNFQPVLREGNQNPQNLPPQNQPQAPHLYQLFPLKNHMFLTLLRK